jgi:cytoskeletal protein RodZ
MALSEEQKRKIEEEEEYRAKIRSEKSISEKKKTHPVTGCLAVLIVIFIVVSVIFGIFASSNTSTNTSQSEPQAEKKTEFKSKVTFTGTQFTITNADDYDCIGSWMSVNGKYWLKGYTLEKGQTYTFGAGEFTEGDNTRFNPFAVKPTTFSIICQGKNELNQAMWVGQF